MFSFDGWNLFRVVVVCSDDRMIMHIQAGNASERRNLNCPFRAAAPQAPTLPLTCRNGHSRLVAVTADNYPATMRLGSMKYVSRGRGGKWDTAGVLLDEAGVGAPVDLPLIFGNARPVEVEIGTGKGTFLLARAAARPELNFLGIEWAKAYCLYSADRFRRAGLTNVRMLRADAAPFFQARLADNSIWRIHVYFPDPWPKRRHHRRRLIQPSFLLNVRRTLRVGGQLLVATDHQEYFRHIRRVLSQAEGFVAVPMPTMCDKDGQTVGTNFERKYIAQGRTVYSVARMRYA